MLVGHSRKSCALIFHKGLLSIVRCKTDTTYLLQNCNLINIFLPILIIPAVFLEYIFLHCFYCLMLCQIEKWAQISIFSFSPKDRTCAYVFRYLPLTQSILVWYVGI